MPYIEIYDEGYPGGTVNVLERQLTSEEIHNEHADYVEVTEEELKIWLFICEAYTEICKIATKRR